MYQDVNIVVAPDRAQDLSFLTEESCKALNLNPKNTSGIEILRRSIDARKPQIKMNLRIRVFQDEKPSFPLQEWIGKDVSKAKESVHIVGFGPAGMFAALQAIELGIKPIVFERGKKVRKRRRDLVKIHREHIINSDSNYCFGEGGAGTYSDGKLYTRSKKRGNVYKCLSWLVHFGAPKDILIDAHPHIGTNKLPKIIENIREEILKFGGEIHFESKLTGIAVKNHKLTAIEVNHKSISSDNLVLATGHSARDIFDLLHQNKLELKAKSIAIGVRIEHLQSLINDIQYHNNFDEELLPPASYSLVQQVEGRGVYSFCMCPGGIVAPCATENGEVVTNGWSPSKRNNRFANSGMVVEIHPEDIDENWENNPFTTLNYQKKIEQKCWEAAGKTQKVPAQRMIDFVEGKKSKNDFDTSYQPGVESVDLNEVLPKYISSRLKKGFKEFGKKLKGYYTNDAVLHAPESRTSSPIQIPRDETLQHPNAGGLYPCGEGAGYAGGIMSAAVDGVKCVDAIFEKLTR